MNLFDVPVSRLAEPSRDRDILIVLTDCGWRDGQAAAMGPNSSISWRRVQRA
jgi:hypothetical protein